MSEILKEVLLKDVKLEQILDYYSHSFYCFNCQTRNDRHILKGHTIAEQMFECDNCGCIIRTKQ